MIAYYKSINNPYEKQLIGSLERDYPAMQESWINRSGFVVLVVVAVLVGGYGVYEILKIKGNLKPF